MHVTTFRRNKLPGIIWSIYHRNHPTHTRTHILKNTQQQQQWQFPPIDPSMLMKIRLLWRQCGGTSAHVVFSPCYRRYCYLVLLFCFPIPHSPFLCCVPIRFSSLIANKVRKEKFVYMQNKTWPLHSCCCIATLMI